AERVCCGRTLTRHFVQLRPIEVPQFDGVEIAQSQIVMRCFANEFAGLTRDKPTVVAQFRGQLEQRVTLLSLVQKHSHLNAAIGAERVDRFGKNIFDESLADEPQLYVAINPAECQVINETSKGRNVLALARI